MQFSHVRVFSDSHNVQKSVTQIIYLRPLPGGHRFELHIAVTGHWQEVKIFLEKFFQLELIRRLSLPAMKVLSG